MSRPATPVVYANDEQFAIGKAKILRKSDSDQVLVIGAGVTLHEALKAADSLKEAGVNIRVMDPFTIKPLDIQAVQDNAAACNGRIITVEDHYPEVKCQMKCFTDQFSKSLYIMYPGRTWRCCP